jgi:peptidoglycan/xylan/chitin deacetylase (PgdA/CDA1 family)
LNPWPIVVGVAAAAGSAAWGAVAPSSEMYGPTMRHTGEAKKIALTFDDGPNPAVTPRLLNLLARYSVPATFFLIGKFARECPELVREMSASGHLVENHTYTHANLIFQSRAGIREELLRCQEAVASATRKAPPQWMRPPWGYRTPWLNAEVRRVGLRGVAMWSRTVGDWRSQAPERLIARLARAGNPGASQGDIIVFHDGDHRALGGDRHHVVAALEHWLPRWRDAGLEFVTIESCVTRDSARATRP